MVNKCCQVALTTDYSFRKSLTFDFLIVAIIIGLIIFLPLTKSIGIEMLLAPLSLIDASYLDVTFFFNFRLF